MRKRVAIIGAGLTGCSAAWFLNKAGYQPVIYEARDEIGGNTRTGCLNGVRYERCGPHIFHTNDKEVWQQVQPFTRTYRHFVKSRTRFGDLCWPPQLFELRKLPIWPYIESELAERPAEQPDAHVVDFETYVTAMMGPTLYNLFIYGYTKKQWNTEPSSLSAVFAPRRIDLRDDPADTYLFRDKHQGWLDASAFIETALLPGIEVFLGQPVCKDHVPEADAHILTCALDDFLHAPPLPWRGVSFSHIFLPQNHLAQTAPVINLPSLDADPTRITESPWLTRFNGDGTMLTYEYPDGYSKSYPVFDAAGANRARAAELEQEVRDLLPKSAVAGRLGKYVYIDMDQAIRAGWNAAASIVRMLSE